MNNVTRRRRADRRLVRRIASATRLLYAGEQGRLKDKTHDASPRQPVHKREEAQNA
jgi:hypothetical protein